MSISLKAKQRCDEDYFSVVIFTDPITASKCGEYLALVQVNNPFYRL